SIAAIVLSVVVGSPSIAHARPKSPTPQPRPSTTGRPFWLKPGQRSEPPADRTIQPSTSSLPADTPGQVVARAASWLTANNGGPIPYSMTTCFPSWSGTPCTPPNYRTDCSGF